MTLSSFLVNADATLVPMKDWNWKYWIKNRYVITLLVSAVYLLFLEEMTLFDLMEYKSRIGEMEQQQEYYEHQILETERSIEELTTNQAALERFAREEHFMKRENEDIFVFIE